MIFFFQAEDDIRDLIVTGVQSCAFLFSSRRRHTRSDRDWSSDVCSSDLFFSARFIVQWVASERRQQSVVPVFFWYFSLGGGLTLFLYAVYRRDPVFILGDRKSVV